MNLFRRGDYAIRCVMYLSRTRGRLATKTEIAEAVSAPALFVAKILQRLVRARILLSVRGVHGGFVLARDPATLSMLDVVEITQSPLAPRPCVVNPRACPLRGSCPVHPVWVRIHRQTIRELSRMRFSALARSAKKPRAVRAAG